MSNVIQLEPKKEVKTLNYYQENLLDTGAFYINELLTRMGRYTKKQIQGDAYGYNKTPYEFYLYQEDTKETWIF